MKDQGLVNYDSINKSRDFPFPLQTKTKFKRPKAAKAVESKEGDNKHENGHLAAELTLRQSSPFVSEVKHILMKRGALYLLQIHPGY